MFQFSGLPSLAGLQVFNLQGCPIRTSTDQRSFATPRSFSQLTTSFVVSESQGIHHTLLFASYSYFSFSSCILYITIYPTQLPLDYFLSLRVSTLLFSPALSMNFLLLLTDLHNHSFMIISYQHISVLFLLFISTPSLHSLSSINFYFWWRIRESNP